MKEAERFAIVLFGHELHGFRHGVPARCIFRIRGDWGFDLRHGT